MFSAGMLPSAPNFDPNVYSDLNDLRKVPTGVRAGLYTYVYI